MLDLMKDLLVGSLYFSIVVQLITISLGFFGLTLRLNPVDQILQSVVGLETLVSCLQLVFYVWYAYHFKEVSHSTFYRYNDWFVTTPIMLFTTMLYYDYKNEPSETKTISSFWKNNQTNILLVFAFNALMLFFGYLYEINVLDLFTSNVMGFAGLIGSFYIIYDSFVKKNLSANLPLFLLMSIIWGFYGIAATFSPIWKNISYNFIDTISKNFYGLFLLYVTYDKAL